MSHLPPGYALLERADASAAHAYLTESYWAKGITLETVKRSLLGSFAVSICHDGSQVAMARVISDFATYAFLTDVYVLDAHQAKGLASTMLRHLLDHPRLQGLARWALFTKDAQSLYAKFGWIEYPMPDRMMVIDARLHAT
jgi:GNAT superfamily N-acetyltransferase